MLLSKKLLFYQNLFPREYYTSGYYDTVLIPGVYHIITRDAGGAGGTNGGASTTDGHCLPGAGGAGGSGKISSSIVKITDVTVAHIYVGEGGLTYDNGGNGGDYGSGGSIGGKGGGGGKPSYVSINQVVYSSNNAGSGGGGGGGASNRGRNANGGGGGGGGGYYTLGAVVTGALRTVRIYFNVLPVEGTQDVVWEFSESPDSNVYVEIPIGSDLYVGKTFSGTQDFHSEIPNVWTTTATVKEIKNDGSVVFYCTETINGSIIEGQNVQNVNIEIRNLNTYTPVPSIISVEGKKGSNFRNDAAGANGVTGNTAAFPNVYSGGGGAGVGHGGSSGASGGGASGGSGGDTGNHSDARCGGGGGGAPGSYNGFGGGRSFNDDGGTQRGGTDGYNAGTTPVDTTAENAEYGITGNYGTGGTTDTNGQCGCVIIRMVSSATEFIDLGYLSTATPEVFDNAGFITDTVQSTDDAGSITGTISSRDDAGTIYTEIEATPWVLGSITATVSETTNCGNII